MRAGVGLVLLALVACASSPRRESGEPPRDRTSDPEFADARQAARPEFETQADALAAGVYEPFVHPDSVGAPSGRAEPAVPRTAGDPSTEELLETLAGAPPRTPPAVAAVEGGWTIQTGAYATESGARARIGQLAREFPELAGWHRTGRDGLVRVYLGRFPDRISAERARGALAARGYDDAWVVEAPR